jgi:hypothetical protein
VDRWRDHDGRPFVHTYFYPAEQYDEGLLEMHRRALPLGLGRDRGSSAPWHSDADTAENTRRVLTDFRDRLAFRHRCLAAEEGSDQPATAFVHGNFALANSAGWPLVRRRFGDENSRRNRLLCGLHAADRALHPAQTAKINSLYECGLPLDQAAPHQNGNRFKRRPRAAHFSADGARASAGGFRAQPARCGRMFETGAITPRESDEPAPARALEAGAHPRGRASGLAVHQVALPQHGSDARRRGASGIRFRKFLEQLVSGAPREKRRCTL